MLSVRTVYVLSSLHLCHTRIKKTFAGDDEVLKRATLASTLVIDELKADVVARANSSGDQPINSQCLKSRVAFSGERVICIGVHHATTAGGSGQSVTGRQIRLGPDPH